MYATISCPRLCAKAPPTPSPREPNEAFGTCSKSHITKVAKTPPQRLIKNEVTPLLSSAKSALTTHIHNAPGNGQNCRENITAILESPSFIPGNIKGRSGIIFSRTPSISATADNIAVCESVRVKGLSVFLLFISSPHYRVGRVLLLR